MADGAIRDAIRKLAGTHLQDTAYIASGEVQDVNIASRSCNIRLLDGKKDAIVEAFLMAAIDDGFLIVPTIGSNVKVIFSEFVPASIFQYSEVERVIIRGGDLGGLTKVAELTQKLNNIENTVNQFIQQFNLHTHAVAGAAASPTPETFTEALTPTVQNEIENLNITQG